MAESTLTSAYEDLRRESATFADWDEDPSKWTTVQSQRFEDALKSALRRYYYPPATEDGGQGHEWSFLWTTAELSILKDISTYTLPDNFPGFLSESFTYATAAGNRRIAQVNSQEIRALQSKDDQSGTALYVALRALNFDPTVGQRYQADFYPTPDANITVEYRYPIQPDTLDATNKYPLGGAVHSQTIKAALLAALDRKLYDRIGIYEVQFQEELRKSIRIDREQKLAEIQSSYPVTGTSTTLSLGLNDFLREVGQFLGFGWNQGSWSHEQFSTVEHCINSGMRQYFYPPPLPGMSTAHEWTFLRESWELTTASGQRVYDLPTDFDSFVGGLSYTGSDWVFNVEITSINRINQLVSQTNYSTYPRLGATRVKSDDHQNPQRQELVLHPTPDSNYTLAAEYFVQPWRLTTDNPYPLGGPAQARGVLTSCMDMAEQFKTNKMGGWHQRFMETLAAGIAQDYRRAPQTLGHMGGRATFRHSRADLRDNYFVYDPIDYTPS